MEKLSIRTNHGERLSADSNSALIIRIWLKAFIPRDLEGTKFVAGDGEHTGKTMLPSPGPINAWFLTDQRDFCDDLNADARMHSEIEIDLAALKMLRQFHACFPTIQVDPDTGEELCKKSAGTESMKFSDFQVVGAKTVSVRLSASSKNACLYVGPVPVAPALDFEGTIAVTCSSDDILVSFDGSIETYPAFEMYASLNNGPAQVIFREEVIPSTSPLNLLGGPTRPIEAHLKIPIQVV